MSLYHLDTDFLVFALSSRGADRRKLDELVDGDVELEMSSIAWFEFVRGPRTPEQLAVARGLFGSEGIVPFTEALAAVAGERFRALGSPRKRAADIAIGVTATARGATLLTRNARDFAGIEGLVVEVAS